MVSGDSYQITALSPDQTYSYYALWRGDSLTNGRNNQAGIPPNAWTADRDIAILKGIPFGTLPSNASIIDTTVSTSTPDISVPDTMHILPITYTYQDPLPDGSLPTLSVSYSNTDILPTQNPTDAPGQTNALISGIDPKIVIAVVLVILSGFLLSRR